MQSDFSMDRRAFIARLPHTWPVRIALALALAGFVYFAIIGIWHGRNLIAFAAIIVLGLVGFNAVMAILPLSGAMRDRMAMHQELSSLYPSYRYKVFLWMGLGSLAGHLWRAYPGPFDFHNFSLPLLLVAAGLAASLIWRFKHQKISGGT
jgi:uncharacterized membrane protein YuzA (DUF378 family)